jgi:hypothetical protein
MKTLSTLFFLLTCALVLAGCAGSANVEQQQRLVWPMPPDEPRIEYVRTHTGERDYPGALSGLLKAIGGEEKGIQLSRPFDVCVDGAGRILVTDIVGGVIAIDSIHRSVTRLGEKSRISLASAKGIAAGHGKTFIGLSEPGQIAVLGPNDSLLYLIGKKETFPNPLDIVCDTLRNRIIIVDNKLHNVFLYSESGDSLMALGKRGEGPGQFNYPQAAAIDSAGNIYVCDAFNFRIEIFDVNGVYQRSFGRQGNVFGMFERMKGIALDSHRNIYVLDGLHQNFQIFSNEGKMLLPVGEQSSGNEGFQNPVSIFIDAQNMIYVTDQINARVQVFRLIKGD